MCVYIYIYMCVCLCIMSHSVHLSFKYQFTKPNPHMSCTCNIYQDYTGVGISLSKAFSGILPQRSRGRDPLEAAIWRFEEFNESNIQLHIKRNNAPAKNLHHIFTGQMKKSWLVTSRTFHKDGCFRAASRVDPRGGTLSGPTYDPVPRKCRPMETR